MSCRQPAPLRHPKAVGSQCSAFDRAADRGLCALGDQLTLRAGTDVSGLAARAFGAEHKGGTAGPSAFAAVPYGRDDRFSVGFEPRSSAA